MEIATSVLRNLPSSCNVTCTLLAPCVFLSSKQACTVTRVHRVPRAAACPFCSRRYHLHPDFCSSAMHNQPIWYFRENSRVCFPSRESQFYAFTGVLPDAAGPPAAGWSLPVGAAARLNPIDWTSSTMPASVAGKALRHERRAVSQREMAHLFYPTQYHSERSQSLKQYFVFT